MATRAQPGYLLTPKPNLLSTRQICHTSFPCVSIQPVRSDPRALRVANRGVYPYVRVGSRAAFSSCSFTPRESEVDTLKHRRDRVSGGTCRQTLVYHSFLHKGQRASRPRVTKPPCQTGKGQCAKISEDYTAKRRRRRWSADARPGFHKYSDGRRAQTHGK